MTRSYAQSAAAYDSKYPVSGTLGSVSAAADGKLDNVQAAARPFSATNGKLVWVKAKEHFYAGGDLVKIGDFQEVLESDANVMIARGQAELSSAEEAAEAAKATK